MSKKLENLNEMIKKDDLIQAVVIADNFSNTFTPLSDDVPVALLPIVNSPIIDYTLECLALGGVQEVFLFCSVHVDQIKNYIREQIDNVVNWSITMSVHIIVSESCRSLGDGMRDIDAKGLLRGDFILLTANNVSNIKFLPILNIHKKNCKKDKGCSMTLIYKEAAPGQASRCPQDEIVLASDKISQKLLFLQKLATQPLATKINISLEDLLNHPTVELRHNLQDTHIAICSSSVLPLFSDNFDFQTKDDLIKGLLNDELLTNSIYWHLTTEYAACVTNWHMYQAVSHDIIHRWAYPFVPDMGINKEEQAYMYLRNNIYRNKTVTLAKGSNLVEDVVIAEGSSIGESSTIIRCVIGKNCKIGKNVLISDSYVMNGTTINDNSKISFSVIGPNCIIGNNATLSESCILGSKVHIESGQVLEAALIQSKKPENANEEDIINVKAYRVRCYSERQDSDSEAGDILKMISKLRIQSDVYSDESSDEEDDDISYESKSEISLPPDDTNLFLTEVIDSLARGYEDKLACDNLILEINSSRYAYNVTLKEVNYNVLKAILSLPFQQTDNKPFVQQLSSLLTYFSPILKNYVKNKSSMMDCLQAIEDTANTCSELIKCVAKIVHWFYNQEILLEESIISWYQKLDKNSRLYSQMKPFINWLEEADEESDSEEESE